MKWGVRKAFAKTFAFGRRWDALKGVPYPSPTGRTLLDVQYRYRREDSLFEAAAVLLTCQGQGARKGGFAIR